MSTQPDPAPWRMSDAETRRFYDDGRWHSAVNAVEECVRLGIVPHPDQHGPGKCVPMDEVESYAIGVPAVDMAGKPLRRCTRCGIPRGTLRHAVVCKSGACDDPDAVPASPEVGQPSNAAVEAACAEVYAGWPTFDERAKPIARDTIRKALRAALTAQNGEAES